MERLVPAVRGLRSGVDSRAGAGRGSACLAVSAVDDWGGAVVCGESEERAGVADFASEEPAVSRGCGGSEGRTATFDCVRNARAGAPDGEVSEERPATLGCLSEERPVPEDCWGAEGCATATDRVPEDSAGAPDCGVSAERPVKLA
jgi:hypothetical protein